MTTKELNEFLTLVVRLEPIKFMGLAQILCADISDEDLTFDELLEQMMNGLERASHKTRRDILKVMRQAVGKEKSAPLSRLKRAVK